MKRRLLLFLLPAASPFALAIQTPTGLMSLAGDQSIILHWEPNPDSNLAGYRVYRSTTGTSGPFSSLTSSALASPG